MADLKTRFLGFCPICEGDFKLHENKLVHHGFKRPGDGYIHGDCMGVGHLPYELSDAVCHLYRTQCQSVLVSLTETLRALKAGEVKTLYVDDYTQPYSRFPKQIEICVVDRRFHAAWESKVHQTERQIRWFGQEIVRMTGHIEAWVLKSVRTIEEEMEAKRAIVAQNKAVREAARQVKRDKAAALQAKYTAREEEKKALMALYKEAFLKLAEKLAEDPFNGNTIGLEAYTLYSEMRKAQGKKGYLSFYPRDLEIADQVWVDLGLASWDLRPGVNPWLVFNRY